MFIYIWSENTLFSYRLIDILLMFYNAFAPVTKVYSTRAKAEERVFFISAREVLDTRIRKLKGDGQSAGEYTSLQIMNVAFKRRGFMCRFPIPVTESEAQLIKRKE